MIGAGLVWSYRSKLAFQLRDVQFWRLPKRLGIEEVVFHFLHLTIATSMPTSLSSSATSMKNAWSSSMEKGDEDWVTWQVFQGPNSNYLVQIYTFLPSYFFNCVLNKIPSFLTDTGLKDFAWYFSWQINPFHSLDLVIRSATHLYISLDVNKPISVGNIRYACNWRNRTLKDHSEPGWASLDQVLTKMSRLRYLC